MTRASRASAPEPVDLRAGRALTGVEPVPRLRHDDAVGASSTRQRDRLSRAPPARWRRVGRADAHLRRRGSTASARRMPGRPRRRRGHLARAVPQLRRTSRPDVAGRRSRRTAASRVVGAAHARTALRRGRANPSAAARPGPSEQAELDSASTGSASGSGSGAAAAPAAPGAGEVGAQHLDVRRRVQRRRRVEERVQAHGARRRCARSSGRPCSRVIPVGSSRSSFVAKLPSVQITRGWMSSTWRNR